MTKYLLDCDILIALSSEDHTHRRRVQGWAKDVGSFAVCPITEGSLMRFIVRMGRTSAQAQATVRMLKSRRGYEFWSDSVSYADADLRQVKGHQQVTDAYLVALTRAHADAKLATMDVALAATYPDVVELIP